MPSDVPGMSIFTVTRLPSKKVRSAPSFCANAGAARAMRHPAAHDAIVTLLRIRVCPNSVNDALPDLFRLQPILVENRPQHLIHLFAIPHERLPKDPFFHGADLLQRAVAAAVSNRRPCLEAMHADGLEREVHDELCAFLEDSRAPERRANRKTPFRGAEPRLGPPDLEDADGRVEPLHRHRKAQIGAGRPLPDRPGDEALEAFN